MCHIPHSTMEEIISEMRAQQAGGDAANKILEDDIIQMKKQWCDLTACINDLQSEYNNKLTTLSKQSTATHTPRSNDTNRVSKSATPLDPELVHSFTESLLHLNKVQRKTLVSLFGSVCELLQKHQMLINYKDRQMNKCIKQMQALANQQQLKTDQFGSKVIRSSPVAHRTDLKVVSRSPEDQSSIDSNERFAIKGLRVSVDQYKREINKLKSEQRTLREKNEKLQQELCTQVKKNRALIQFLL